MYRTKTDFVNDFKKRMQETYGRNVESSDITEKYMVLGNIIRDFASVNWMETKEENAKQENKMMYYFSMEFLMGRLMTNNLMNLGIYDVVKEGLNELDIDINE